MSQIRAQVRLRPVRFAYLVRPDDSTKAAEVFEINTCLWGGRFNPIIPCFKQVPKWWDRHHKSFESANEIINGYLDFFEPDFIVETQTGLSTGLGFDPARVLTLENMLFSEGDQGQSGYGLNIHDLYKDLYRKDYKFVRRNNHNIIDVVAKDRAFSAFCACLFGAFPKDPGLGYLSRGFKEAFGPEEVSLTGSVLSDLFSGGFTSALRIGISNIDPTFHNSHEPVLFVLDAKKPRDLIDFWNLRAVRPRVLPIPLQWLDELTAFAKQYIADHHQPLRGNPNGVMTQATVMFSRSIPTNEIERIHESYFLVDIEGANVRQDWYPSFWRPHSDHVLGDTRPTLTAERRTFDLPYRDSSEKIQFECLYPPFADEWGNSYRWANVVELTDWAGQNQAATVYPCEYRNPTYPNFGFGREILLPTTEGLVTFPRYKDIPESWEIPDGTTAVGAWLKTNGIKAFTSDAGRSTQQIIQTLGGIWGVSCLANSKVIELLNEITRKPTTRTMQHQAFEQRLKCTETEGFPNLRSFENLVEKKAVELGLELKCAKCAHWSWYALDQLGQFVRCSLCLQQFEFPTIHPNSSTHSRWVYRLIGPFALPDYSRGGYSAALSIRLLGARLGSVGSGKVTWSAGQELEFSQTKRVESDFILWYQREMQFGVSHPTEIVFGEAKSFGKDAFQDNDVQRMKELAIRFPGSVLVFSTMKRADELSSEEIHRISKLAMWGREFIRGRNKTRAPIILLTGSELFTPFSLQDTWSRLGGKHEQLGAPGWVRLDNLRVLADCTQQLYLNLPPYAEWLRAKWKKRADRKKASGS